MHFLYIKKGIAIIDGFNKVDESKGDFWVDLAML